MDSNVETTNIYSHPELLVGCALDEAEQTRPSKLRAVSWNPLSCTGDRCQQISDSFKAMDIICLQGDQQPRRNAMSRLTAQTSFVGVNLMVA